MTTSQEWGEGEEADLPQKHQFGGYNKFNSVIQGFMETVP